MQSESFVSCYKEKGANKRDKNKGNFSKKKKKKKDKKLRT